MQDLSDIFSQTGYTVNTGALTTFNSNVKYLPTTKLWTFGGGQVSQAAFLHRKLTVCLPNRHVYNEN